jgi:hypothetical protein
MKTMKVLPIKKKICIYSFRYVRDSTTLPPKLIYRHLQSFWLSGYSAWSKGTGSTLGHSPSLSEINLDPPRSKRWINITCCSEFALSWHLGKPINKVYSWAPSQFPFQFRGARPAGKSLFHTHQQERALGCPVSRAAWAILLARQNNQGKACLLVPLSSIKHIKLRKKRKILEMQEGQRTRTQAQWTLLRW